MTQVVFVCTGNMCRSPTAEALFNARAEAAGLEVRASSRGTLGDGMESPPDVVRAGAEAGLDLTDHRSRRLAPTDARAADLVLGMAREHVREIVLATPEVWPHTFTLRELVRRGRAVGPRRRGQKLDDWLLEVHGDRRHADLIGFDPADDVEDPMGHSYREHQEMVTELGQLIESSIRLIWPRTVVGGDPAGRSLPGG